MSVGFKLDQLIAEFKENVDQLDSTTQNLANSKSRTALEFKKNLAIVEKFNLPPEKFQMVFDTIQEIMNICSNYTPPQELAPSAAETTKPNAMKIGAAADGAEADDNFEQFKATVTERVAQLEKECCKLDTLKEFLQQIKAERDMDWNLNVSPRTMWFSIEIKIIRFKM